MNEKRNTSGDRKIIKKIVKITAIALASLAVLTLALYGATEWIRRGSGTDTVSNVSGIYFFPADYEYNIYEDELYMSYDRRIMFTAFGQTCEITSSDAGVFGTAGAFFHDYFGYIINGDCEGYKSCFTESGRSTTVLPEKFTMQMLYDINVILFSRESREVDGRTVTVDVYEVSYRIFENNGTFRGDISSGDTRTLVYELYIEGENAAINAIGYRKNAD